MKARRLRSYPHTDKESGMRTGKTVYVFGIFQATPEEKAKYKALRAENYREEPETGIPLFFTLNNPGKTVAEIHFTQDGTNVYIDDSEMREKASLIDQFAGTPLGAALANQYAAELLAKVSPRGNTTTTAAPAETEVDADANMEKFFGGDDLEEQERAAHEAAAKAAAEAEAKALADKVGENAPEGAK